MHTDAAIRTKLANSIKKPFDLNPLNSNSFASII